MASNVVIGGSVSFVTSVAVGRPVAPFTSVPIPLVVPAPPPIPPDTPENAILTDAAGDNVMTESFGYLIADV